MACISLPLSVRNICTEGYKGDEQYHIIPNLLNTKTLLSLLSQKSVVSDHSNFPRAQYIYKLQVYKGKANPAVQTETFPILICYLYSRQAHKHLGDFEVFPNSRLTSLFLSARIHFNSVCHMSSVCSYSCYVLTHLHHVPQWGFSLLIRI